MSGPVLCLLFSVCTANLWLPAIGHWLVLPSQTVDADAIVVLSGGGPERLVRGIELYRQGLAPQLWHTGDVAFPEMTHYSDGELARRFAIEEGVPPEAIRLLPTTSTWEDALEIAALARRSGMQRILVVTSWYHSRRALCVMQHQLRDDGIHVYYASPAVHMFGPDNWWQHEDGLVLVTNELLKFAAYGLKYGVSPFEC